MAIKIKQNHLNYLAYFSILNITILAITLLLPYCHDTVNAVEDTLTTEAGLNVGSSKRLIDTRDGNKYWVAKLQDDNCWMTQNLALNLVADEAIKPTDSDVSMEWNSRSKYPPRDTNAVKFPGGNFEAAIATNSWNLGKAVYATPLHNTVCNSYGAVYGSYYSLYSTDKYGEKCGKVGFIDITDEWQPTLVAQEGEYTFPDGTTYTGLVAANPENKTYDAHYLVGNFYQYNAATGLDTKAGTSAPESICPKGWKLPTASTTGFETKGSFAYLLRQYGLATSSTAGIISNDEYNIAALPFSYVRTGEVDSQYSTIFDAGTISSFWSSYPGVILYSHNISLSPSFSTVNTRGHSVRCVVVTE